VAGRHRDQGQTEPLEQQPPSCPGCRRSSSTKPLTAFTPVVRGRSGLWSVRSRKHLNCVPGGPGILVCPGPLGPPPFARGPPLLDDLLSMSLPRASRIRPSILSNAASRLHSFSGVRALRITGRDTFAVEASLMLHRLGPLPENVTRHTGAYLHLCISIHDVRQPLPAPS